MRKTVLPSIHFFFEHPARLRERTRLKQFLGDIFKKEKIPLGHLNYIFCSDEKLLSINREFLKHDYYTDIITFGLSAPGSSVEADIYISVERVKDNAAKHGEPMYRELHRVIFHGALHLCGYKDKTREEKALMREKEDFYLLRYG